MTVQNPDNSNNPAPAPTPAPADPTPPAGDPPANDPTPAPAPAPNEPPKHDPSKTQDPVVPNQPPANDPNNPDDNNPDDSNAPTPAPNPDGDDDDDPTIANVLDTPEKDDTQKAIDAKAENGQLPQGVNPDGTVDPALYAYENLPEITVKGKEGRGGEIKEYTVKTAADLPDNFMYANAKEQATFSQALGQNMNIAQQLMDEANNYNTNRTAQNQATERAVAQKGEIEQLVKDGRLPEIKAKHTDKNFMEDPGAKRAQQVIDHMNKLNKQFEEAGSSQRIESIELALTLLEAEEVKQSNDNRRNGIVSERNDINRTVSGGGVNPAASGTGNQQRAHRNVQDAVSAGLKRAGKL